MSRARQKSKPEAESLLSRLEALRAVGGLAAVTVVMLGVIFVLERVKSHVYALPEYNPKACIELAEAPEWIDAEGWRQRILNSVRLPASQPWLDHSLVREVADQMRRSGWVSQVKRVTQYPDGRVLIACDFRRPIAMVQTPRGYVAVDQEGVRLPEVYEDVPSGTGWMRIIGLEAAVPATGERFSSDDAVAAVRLAGLIFEQEFSQRITAIDMSNFRGRRDRRANHICLRTRDGGKIDWGSAIGEEIEEPTAHDKIRTIALYFKRGSPQAQVDVSVYRDGYIKPTPESDLHTADGSRSR